MLSCYQYRSGTDIGQNELEQVKGGTQGNAGAPGVYQQYMICNGGSNDGNTCTALGTNTSECPSGTCVNGPGAIRPGSPVLLFSSAYTGYCAAPAGTAGNPWDSTTWVARGYLSEDDCIKAKYRQYCGDVSVPPVTDPTDSTSQTDLYANLPAIIADMGIESQLGSPLATLKVQNKMDTAPKGLLQDFSDNIRFGGITFNYNGSPSECPASVPCPRKCSSTTSRSCTTYLDCPSGETCVATTSNTDNLDGGKVIAYVGDPGVCSDNSPCSKDSDCSAGKCISVGNHDYGLVNAVDKIRAATWTPFAEAFYDAMGYLARSNDYTASPATSRTDLRLNTSDFAGNKNPSQYPCQANNVLLLTDGFSTADRQSTVAGVAGIYPTPQTAATCPLYAGSTYLENLAWIAKNRNIKTLSSAAASPAPTNPLQKSEYMKTYVVFTGASNGQTGNCESETMMSNTATNGGTSLKNAQDPSDLENELRTSLQEIIARSSSGTAASVLASGEGSGANLIQALFYPKTPTLLLNGMFGSELLWIGKLQNFWYYLDPFLSTSQIREDTVTDKTLNLSNDYIMKTYFDTSAQTTRANLFADTNADGVADSSTPNTTKKIEYVNNLWDAGTLLWQRDVSANPRTIYTSCIDGANCISGTNLMSFSTSNSGNVAVLQPYLQASSGDEANAIIQYTGGMDNPVVSGVTYSYRTRTTAVDLNGNGTITDTGEGTKVWKLGDVLNSTPRISSWMALNTYNWVYKDSTYGFPGQDVRLEDSANTSHFTSTSQYKARGMVFSGANDSMLHAFKLGTVQPAWSGQGTNEKARVINPDTGAVCSATDTSPCGMEKWAFIPKNVLPYLKYIADPAYCHLYTVDLAPFVFDASINGSSTDTKVQSSSQSSWKTILIGGMRLGGACSKGTCSNDSTPCILDADCGTGNSCSTAADTVKLPTKDPADSTKGLGYSSYFALDVTDQNNPVLKWEFSDDSLGFSTTGPAVVRVGDRSQNGSWFVVIGSGPTGPITTDKQFLGHSDQNLKIFILDLSTGTVLRTIDTLIPNAFAGSMYNSTHDIDLDYQDDVLYIPYVKKASDGSWTDGGIIRLVTKENSDPSQWTWSKVMDGIGPVTSAVQRLSSQIKGQVWLYFGTGRYYFDEISNHDDPTNQRQIFGVKEPCYSSLLGTIDPSCDSSLSLSDLTDVTNISNVPTNPDDPSFKGWYINLDSSGYYTYCESYNYDGSCKTSLQQSYRAERVITDPVASATGLVVFTSYKPYTDVCSLGGKSFLWAVRYNTGGAPSAALLKGAALLQVSTGSIEQLNLATAFTAAGGRKTTAVEGKPPEGSGITLLTSPPAVKRVIHMRER